MDLVQFFNDPLFSAESSSEFDRLFDNAFPRSQTGPAAVAASRFQSQSAPRALPVPPKISSMDVHGDGAKNIVGAMFELPGIDQHDVSAALRHNVLVMPGQSNTRSENVRGGLVAPRARCLYPRA
ncbi:hypothetical protein BC628DRAFT_1371380 [Trametes gibbosa]|nr:hypothetical protein BC628DRAFT_1371380 [Trametes gibbosa]